MKFLAGFFVLRNMRKIVFFIFAIEFFDFSAQTKAFYPNTKIKVTLPGVIKVNDSLYCDENEINNLGYREFFWAKIIHDYCLKNNVDSLIKSKSFSMVKVSNFQTEATKFYRWDESVLYGLKFDIIPFNGDYWSHPALDMFPIMGISHRNATLFCKWRTNKVFELFLTKNKVIREFHPLDTNIFTIEKYFSGNFHGIKPDTNYLYYFEYSLPTREEWTQSLISSNYENGRYKYPNHQTNPKQTFIDFPEFEYKKCKIKNLNNNVSEWLIDSNQYIGLNWQDSFDLNKLTIVRESNRPSAVIGFRNIGKWKKWEGKVSGM